MIRLLQEKKNQLILMVILLVTFSWVPTLDNYSDEYTDASILQAGAAYATARGINALISTLQTSTIQVGLGVEGSITVGEVLDPLNDLIERFSQVMTVALGSLLLQKILLVITADTIFKILITLAGVAAIVGLWLGKAWILSFLWKGFVLLVFVRYALCFVVSLNSIVDKVFLAEDIELSSGALENIKGEVSNLQNKNASLEKRAEVLRLNILVDKNSIQKIKSFDLPAIENQLTIINRRLQEAEAALDKNVGLMCRLNPLCEEAGAREAKELVSGLEIEEKELKNKLSQQKRHANEIESGIKLKEKKLAGDDVGGLTRWLPNFHELGEALNPESIAKLVSDNVSNVVRLLVLFLLKSILIPLLFFYAFIGFAKSLWRLEWSGEIGVSKKPPNLSTPLQDNRSS
ncbi:MAG: hypothetical protein GY799_20865 [Desulfobulbaceae bacterium]|nr:hypothetical protein [Desulfobulbaceae bacterium]